MCILFYSLLLASLRFTSPVISFGSLSCRLPRMNPCALVLGSKSISFHLSCDDFASWRCQASLSTRLSLVLLNGKKLEGNKWKKKRKTKRQLLTYFILFIFATDHSIWSLTLGTVIYHSFTLSQQSCYQPSWAFSGAPVRPLPQCKCPSLSDTDTLPNFWGLIVQSVEPSLQKTEFRFSRPFLRTHKAPGAGTWVSLSLELCNSVLVDPFKKRLVLHRLPDEIPGLNCILCLQPWGYSLFSVMITSDVPRAFCSPPSPNQQIPY